MTEETEEAQRQKRYRDRRVTETEESQKQKRHRDRKCTETYKRP